MKNVTRLVSAKWTNGLMPEGIYTFDAEGKMVMPEPKNGLVDGYYYVDGVPTHAGLVLIDGDYYYIDRTCQPVKNVTRLVSAKWTNGLLPAGTYTFGADGKMIMD